MKTNNTRTRRAPAPRVSYFYGMRSEAIRIGETWLEDESITYPSGAMIRRCRARCEDGRLRVVRCGIPDTYFSIPAGAWIAGRYVRGYVGSNEDGFYFSAYTGTPAPDGEHTPAAPSTAPSNGG